MLDNRLFGNSQAGIRLLHCLISRQSNSHQTGGTVHSFRVVVQQICNSRFIFKPPQQPSKASQHLLAGVMCHCLPQQSHSHVPLPCGFEKLRNRQAQPTLFRDIVKSQAQLVQCRCDIACFSRQPDKTGHVLRPLAWVEPGQKIQPFACAVHIPGIHVGIKCQLVKIRRRPRLGG